MGYNEIYEQVGKEMNLPPEVVKKAYHLYWRFIRDTIESLPLRTNLSEEEFSSLRTHFNIPSLGKLTCTYDRYKGVTKRLEYIRSLRIRKRNGDNQNKEN